jgi:hypothetical protein
MGKIDRLSIARPHQSTFYNKLYDHKPLHPESAEIIPLGSQGEDLCFLKQKCMRNSKMASKQSIVAPTQYYNLTFSKNYFRHQKSVIFARFKCFFQNFKF